MEDVSRDASGATLEPFVMIQVMTKRLKELEEQAKVGGVRDPVEHWGSGSTNSHCRAM